MKDMETLDTALSLIDEDRLLGLGLLNSRTRRRTVNAIVQGRGQWRFVFDMFSLLFLVF